MACAGRTPSSLVLLVASMLATLKGLPYSAVGSQAPDPGVGAAQYSERCAVCHGGDARGGNGRALVNLWASGATDDRVLRTIRQGVPGSAMTPSTGPDEDLRAIVAYRKTLAPPGALAAGERGGAPAPIAITLVMRDGRRISGMRRGEDAFSVQIEDTQGRLQGFSKDAVQEIVRGTASRVWCCKSRARSANV